MQQENRTTENWWINRYATTGTIWKRNRSFLSVAKEHVTNTNVIRKIYHKDVSNKCRYVDHIWRMFNAMSVVAWCLQEKTWTSPGSCARNMFPPIGYW